MKILDYLKFRTNSRYAKNTFGSVEKPYISFDGDKFSYTYADSEKIYMSNGMKNNNRTIEIKAVYNIDQSTIGSGKFSHLEKIFCDGFTTTTLCYKTEDDLPNNSPFESTIVECEETEFSTTKKESLKQYRKTKSGDTVCFLVRDTCETTTKADSVKDIFNINSKKPLTRKVKSVAQIRVPLAEKSVTMENFDTLYNRTSVIYELGKEHIYKQTNFTLHSNFNNQTKLEKSLSKIKIYGKDGGKLVLENDRITQASGTIGTNFFTDKNLMVGNHEKEFFETVADKYSFPSKLYDGASFYNDIVKHSNEDLTTPEYLEDKFYAISFVKNGRFITKDEIKETLNKTLDEQEFDYDIPVINLDDEAEYQNQEPIDIIDDSQMNN